MRPRRTTTVAQLTEAPAREAEPLLKFDFSTLPHAAQSRLRQERAASIKEALQRWLDEQI